ncbi:MAG: hypothetical protein QW545_07585, partial [Thermosphaera sp.]
LPLEPVGYTIEEFSEMLKKENRFILKILEEGEILYASERMMKIFFRRFEVQNAFEVAPKRLE